MNFSFVIWYTRDNHAQMYVHLRNSNNKLRLGSIYFISCRSYSTAEETWHWSKRVLCIRIIMFWNFTIINCGLSCSHSWSVVFHCCGFGKPFWLLHPNCCLVFQRFVVKFLECTCLCYSGWLLLLHMIQKDRPMTWYQRIINTITLSGLACENSPL